MAPGDSYSLDGADTVKLSRIIRSVTRARSPSPAFQQALRRFNFAYERSRPSDRLIDHWIALEALFLPSQDQELRFRAAMRVAYFLGEKQRRQNIYKAMLDSYDGRS